jgi:hypothetical protein
MRPAAALSPAAQAGDAAMPLVLMGDVLAAGVRQSQVSDALHSGAQSVYHSPPAAPRNAAAALQGEATF